jgi:hypothetical protein
MKSFAIDLYLWDDDISEWLLVPARGAGLRWAGWPGISSHSALLDGGADVPSRHVSEPSQGFSKIPF